MFCCYELWLGLLILKYLHLGIQADVKIDKYEYDGKTVVPKHVTGCQDEKTGILLRAIRISKKSNEIALLPYDITNTDHLELWIEFTNRCNGKRQCQMNQMKLLKNMFDIVLLSPETNTTIETEFVCKPIDGDNVYRIATNFKQVINKVGSSSVYLMYNKTSENKVVCHVIADTKFVTVEILHFEWIPSDCKNSKDRISVYRHDFDCSWTKGKKAVTVQQPHNITIELLKQSGFVWLEVQTVVADGRTTQLNLTCDLDTVSTTKIVTATKATPVIITTISPRELKLTSQTSRSPSVNTTRTQLQSLTTNTSRNVVTMSNSGSEQDVARFNDQCLPVIITLCVLLTIAVAVILFLAYKLKKRNRRSSINVYSTTKGSNQDIHLYNDTVDLNQYETVKEASPNTYNNLLSNVLI
uniref:Grctm7 protein n=1 Tax=Biomphalaria glabrata TaxID=6526 RepID=A0A0C9S372_BIOGL